MHRAFCKRTHLPVMQPPLIDSAARFDHLESKQVLDSSMHTLALRQTVQIAIRKGIKVGRFARMHLANSRVCKAAKMCKHLYLK
jgi:hypothetical protein